MKSVIYFVLLFYIFGPSTCFGLKCIISSNPVISVNCSNMELIDLPPDVLPLKNHTNVKKLILQGNKFNSAISFQGWDSLIYLDVSQNNINVISDTMFSSLTHLKFLNLSYNNISELSNSTFDNLTVLEILDLSGNPLLGHKIDMINSSLASLLFRSLKMFTMRSSEISSLPIDIFENSPELQYLDLSDNNISVIPILPMGLIYFKANNNSIRTISILTFQKSEMLKDLFLENNALLSEIDVDAFETLYNLRNLSLKGSKSLRHLPSNILYFNKKLKYLSLAECGLASLPHSFKSKFLEIPTVELQGNPWTCNISIKWFMLLKASDDENLRCSLPGNFSFVEYYGIGIRQPMLRNLLFGLLFLVFVLFGLAIYVSFATEKRRRTQMTYFPLGGKPHFQNGVYVTTVV